MSGGVSSLPIRGLSSNGSAPIITWSQDCPEVQIQCVDRSIGFTTNWHRSDTICSLQFINRIIETQFFPYINPNICKNLDHDTNKTVALGPENFYSDLCDTACNAFIGQLRNDVSVHYAPSPPPASPFPTLPPAIPSPAAPPAGPPEAPPGPPPAAPSPASPTPGTPPPLSPPPRPFSPSPTPKEPPPTPGTPPPLSPPPRPFSPSPTPKEPPPTPGTPPPLSPPPRPFSPSPVPPAAPSPASPLAPSTPPPHTPAPSPNKPPLAPRTEYPPSSSPKPPPPVAPPPVTPHFPPIKTNSDVENLNVTNNSAISKEAELNDRNNSAINNSAIAESPASKNRNNSAIDESNRTKKDKDVDIAAASAAASAAAILVVLLAALAIYRIRRRDIVADMKSFLHKNLLKFISKNLKKLSILSIIPSINSPEQSPSGTRAVASIQENPVETTPTIRTEAQEVIQNIFDITTSILTEPNSPISPTAHSIREIIEQNDDTTLLRT